MKIVYMGTPEFSKVCLEGILENNYNVTLVLTNEDKKNGRGLKIVKIILKYINLKV